MPNVKLWQFGCELEIQDWNSNDGLPDGFKRSPDYTIVNSNSIAAQPNPKVYPIGGEINTPPTNTIIQQLGVIDHLFNCIGRHQPNHRSNLHIHVHVPGLKEDLAALKQLQRYIHTQLPLVIDLLEPIPEGTTSAAHKREKRRRVSHHTFLSATRLSSQLWKATTTQGFFEREVPRSKTGQVMWHAQPRVCVNLRQLLQTNTVEIRHFPGTISLALLTNCFNWCRDFLIAALEDKPIDKLWGYYDGSAFPQFPEFDCALEVGYQATAAHNGLKQSEIKQNIKAIQEGTFYGSEAYHTAVAKTEGRKVQRGSSVSR